MMARVVFDLDGTLIDSAPDIRGIANRLMEAEGRPGITLEQTRSFIGNGAATFVRRLREARDIREDEQDRLYRDFVAAYDEAVTLTVPYAGVETSLGRLRQEGHALGICTNKPLQPTHAVLRHLGLDGLFSAVLGGDSLPVHKPDPAPLHATLDALPDGPPIYVGDSEVDAETARRAGLPFLLFTGGYRKTPVEEIPHTARFDHHDDLPDLIAQHIA